MRYLMLIGLLLISCLSYAVNRQEYSCPSAQWVNDHAKHSNLGGMLALDMQYKGMYYSGKTNIKYTTGDFDIGKLVRVRLYGEAVNCIYQPKDTQAKLINLTNNGDTWGEAYFVNGKGVEDCKGGEQICIPSETNPCAYVVCEVAAAKK